MSVRFTLQPVMDLARDGADAATARLGQAMQRLMNADRQLQTLLQYREEYQAKFRDSVASGIEAARWRNFQLFLAKLDAGIEGARAQADAAREAAKRAQTEWQEQQRKLKAYGVLADRHERAQQSETTRREQRETDEHAANFFSRNAPAHRRR
ncbi:MAG: flagellar export protein FliJ [Betaproteobacteria bacterium]|nr:MAG: flagellar export protein FliJ [Betaproteobacteria bacterium]